MINFYLVDRFHKQVNYVLGFLKLYFHLIQFEHIQMEIAIDRKSTLHHTSRNNKQVFLYTYEIHLNSLKKVLAMELYI